MPRKKGPAIQEVPFCDAEAHVKMASPELLYRFIVMPNCEKCQRAYEEARDRRVSELLFGSQFGGH